MKVISKPIYVSEEALGLLNLLMKELKTASINHLRVFRDALIREIDFRTEEVEPCNK